MNPFLQKLMANKHTNAAAIVYGLCWLSENIAPIWFPSHQPQFLATAERLKEFCIIYGFAMGGDAKPTFPSDNDQQPPSNHTIDPMKKIALLIGFAALALALPGRSQTTNPPANTGSISNILSIPNPLTFLTNLPTTTNATQAHFAFEQSITLKAAGAESLTKGDFYLKTNWMFSGEMLTAPVSTGIDALGVLGGYRRAYQNAELYGQLGARRTFTTTLGINPCTQAQGVLGASWNPNLGGNFYLTGSLGIFSSANGFTHTPMLEPRAGLKFLF